MDHLLIDTDVLLDFLFDRQPFSDDAAKLLSLCDEGKIKGFITSVMVSNIYYILRKNAGHEKVIESLKLLMNMVDVVTTDKQTIIEALHSGFKDFEDALQNFSAQNRADITLIITRNVKDYKASRLSIMDPETYLNLRNFSP